MTRVLSELLGTDHLSLQAHLSHLERLSGHDNTDIRVTTEVIQSSLLKVRELGLDPKDTTAQELYQTLKSRIGSDEARLLQTLQQKFAGVAAEPIPQIARALETLPLNLHTFSLKQAVAKKLLQKAQPKKLMKQLGYRSFDSLLKHEPANLLLTVGWATESTAWQKSVLGQYKKLSCQDFEIRTISAVSPVGPRWQKVTTELALKHKHTVLSRKELGTVVLLPLPEDHAKGSVLLTVLFALEACNDIKTASTFLKLSQVKTNFGAIVQMVARNEPLLESKVLDEPVSWHLIQRYYAQSVETFKAEIFEPHIDASDLSWQSIERALLEIEPSMEFWVGSHFLSFVRDHVPVSLNIMDAAFNFCNDIPLERQVRHHSQASLLSELTVRYLQPHHVEQAILGHLQLALEPELATN